MKLDQNDELLYCKENHAQNENIQNKRKYLQTMQPTRAYHLKYTNSSIT